MCLPLCFCLTLSLSLSLSLLSTLSSGFRVSPEVKIGSIYIAELKLPHLKVVYAEKHWSSFSYRCRLSLECTWPNVVSNSLWQSVWLLPATASDAVVLSTAADKKKIWKNCFFYASFSHLLQRQRFFIATTSSVCMCVCVCVLIIQTILRLSLVTVIKIRSSALVGHWFVYHSQRHGPNDNLLLILDFSITLLRQAGDDNCELWICYCLS